MKILNDPIAFVTLWTLMLLIAIVYVFNATQNPVQTYKPVIKYADIQLN